MRSAGSLNETSFPVTRWTLVQAVQGDKGAEAARAMEDLCSAYWYPIYAFLRRSGRNAPDGALS